MALSHEKKPLQHSTSTLACTGYLCTSSRGDLSISKQSMRMLDAEERLMHSS